MKLSLDFPKGFFEDESREIVIPARRKKEWAVSLDLLVQLDKVCKKHGIRYFCDGGTALGAARHDGFIPWDDDIDVCLAREEYDRLCEIGPSEFKSPYFFQTNDTDPGTARGHAQLRNSETTAVLHDEMCDGKALFRYNQGMFIDIFPFDNVPDDAAERKKYLDEMQRFKDRIEELKFGCASLAMLKRNHWTAKAVGHVLLSWSRAPLDPRSWTRRLNALHAKMERHARKYIGVKTREKAPVTFMPHHPEVLPSSYFDRVTEHDFEFLKIPLFKDYESVLTRHYGNWHEHVIGASSHGGLYVNPDRPYADFIS